MADYRPMVEPLLMRQCQRWYHTEFGLKEGRHILLGIEADPVTYGLGKAAPPDDSNN